MKCISCETAINPKWKHAIEQNICPYCGQSIMDERLKQLLSELSDIMSSLTENYQSELDDWMISNFSYWRKGGGVSAKSNDTEAFVEDQATNGTIINKVVDEKASEFLQRAELNPQKEGFASMADRTAHLKEMVAKVKAKSGHGYADPEITNLLKSAINPNESPFTSPDESYVEGYEEDEIPSVVYQVANAKNNTQSSDYNPKDVAALQRLVGKSKKMGGSFRR